MLLLHAVLLALLQTNSAGLFLVGSILLNCNGGDLPLAGGAAGALSHILHSGLTELLLQTTRLLLLLLLLLLLHPAAQQFQLGSLALNHLQRLK